MRELNLSGLLALLTELPEYRDLINRIRSGDAGEPLGLPEPARSYLVAGLQEELARPILLVASTAERARRFWEGLQTWSTMPHKVHLFPEPGARPYERAPWDRSTVHQRLSVLAELANPRPAVRREPLIVVASARSLIQGTLPVDLFVEQQMILQREITVPMQDLLGHLVALGYQPVSLVARPGTFSRRGGLVDAWPPDSPRPVRIDFFGDEIDALRAFDPASQRSEEHLATVIITPASEGLPRNGEDAAAALGDLDLSQCSERAADVFREHRERLQEGGWFREIEFYLPYLYERPGTLIDYLPQEGLVVVDDTADVKSAVADLEAQAVSLRRNREAEGQLPADFRLPYLTWDDLEPALRQRGPLTLGYDGMEQGGVLGERFAPGRRYGGRLKEVIIDAIEWTHGDHAVVVVTRQAGRLAELFEDWGIFVSPVQAVEEPPERGELILVEGGLSEGWKILPEGWGRPWSADRPHSSLVLLSDGEIFGWRMPQPRRQQKEPARGTTGAEAFFTELSLGDYVVHIEHGIGVFRGLVRMDLGGVDREYLQIEYAAGDKLYVPTYQVDRVSRYVGASDQGPQIHRLGTTDWERVKSRAKRAVEDIARELLEIYAAREVVEGHAFSPDTPWQAELEGTFPYVETEDQLRAIEDVKADMEQPQPMDRLICGDVGYGKTEVALRAAFKAVMDGKQVAMLVPTTVLAQQHYNTFTDRLSQFPVKVEMLSRFRTAKEQDQAVEGLKAGAVDIVIGTHRLLQRDIAFKDLGLLIIDEEQRFGVTHKETLKAMRTEVDVLTMTATPIPRTLHMSLTGVRDMSTIDTAPQERLPVVTDVSAYDEALIRQAVLREMDRDGQTFFVHNRVQSIGLVARRLGRIVPEADIAIAHGQMDESELARIMPEFASGKHDVLVCTSIIESGLDMPNVNTLIVDRADLFGLADLYQLRGRVGRGVQRAYAYFLYRDQESLTDDARKRLRTILEASELGAGFRIAMKDLEIRGAGDLLGPQQHGHISAVGFDMYCRLLAQAVRELKGEEPAKVLAGEEPLLQSVTGGVQVDLPIDAYLPEDYVPEVALRLRLYRRMAELQGLAEVEDMAGELADRFGDPPRPVKNLLYLLQLKVLAAQAGARTVVTENGRLVVKFGEAGVPNPTELKRRFDGRMTVGARHVALGFDEGRSRWREDLPEVLRAMAE